MTETVKSPETEILKARLEAQKKDKLVHLLIGLLVGLLVGFVGTNWLNSNPSLSPTANQTAAAGEEMPHDHPPVEGEDDHAESGAAMPEVQAKLKAAEENPQDFDAQMEAAAMFHRIKNLEKAIPFLERATQIRPEDYDAIVILANTLFDVQKYAEARPLYEKASKMKPTDINVMTDLGTTYFALGDKDKAIATFNRSLEIDPKHEKTLMNLTVVNIRKGDVAGAEQALGRLSSAYPSNQAISNLRAEIDELKTTGKIPTH